MDKERVALISQLAAQLSRHLERQGDTELRRYARIQAEEAQKVKEEAERAKEEKERKAAPMGCLTLVIIMVILAIVRWLLRWLGVIG